MFIGRRNMNERNVYGQSPVFREKHGDIRKEHRHVAGTSGVDGFADVFTDEERAQGEVAAPVFVCVVCWAIGMQVG